MGEGSKTSRPEAGGGAGPSRISDHDTLPLVWVTSVPKSVSRLDVNGDECGDAYQKACIGSWTSGSLGVLSVNAAEETQVLNERYPNLRVATVEQDAREESGRQLPYLHDMIRVAAAEGGRWCGLVNADILLAQRPWLAEMLRSHGSNGLMMARRVDINWPDCVHGDVYRFGLDLFVMDRAVADALPASTFAVGLPWWDFWLPIMAYLHGFDLYLLKRPVALHLTHSIRWCEDEWLEYGLRLFEEMTEAATRALADESLADRGRYILNALAATKESLNDPNSREDTVTAMSIFLQWFCDKGPAVTRLGE